MEKFPVRIYAASVRPLEDERLFCTARVLVTEERRQKADRLRFPGDRRLSLGAELLLLYGLSASGLDVSPGHLQFRYGENGKPYLEGVEGVYFNLSHSGEMVLCAIGPDEVGCDVEKIRDHGMNLAKRFFAPEEYELLAALEDEEARCEMFCRIWTLKESFLKITGQGIRMELSSFRILPGESKTSVVQCGERRDYYFREYHAAEGYCCAACALRNEFEESVRMVDLGHLSELAEIL